jgi:3-hydroxyisobutyrate dehydrogenase-like beta-hydroxyacid dehydrogenase
MGAAIAARLAGEGHSVVGWTRSGRTPTGITTVSDAGAAVDGARVVLLCLFDGEACFSVLAQVRARLTEGMVVVNTSTVAPAEAESLAADARAAGADYVHAPVIGSLPAVASGTLTILAGCTEYGGIAPVLEALGEVVTFPSPTGAAAAKLVANGILASALLALRAGRAAAEELGLTDQQAWAVLERTSLGGIVRAKRTRLEAGAFADADFTVAALAKDLGLLSDVAPSTARLDRAVRHAVDTGAVADTDDVSALVVMVDGARPHRLLLAPTVSAPPEILAPLEAYVAGHATGDPAHHRRAFWPTAHIEGLRDGRFVSWTLEEYCELFSGRPADDESRRTRRVEDVHWDGTVGTATMTLHHGPHVFTDSFVLLRIDDEWRIANKVYHRA